MPRLLKGGKLAYGWSCVGDDGRVIIPPEAIIDYGLREFEDLIILPGSKTSGGFALGSWVNLRVSPLSPGVNVDSSPGDLWQAEGEIIEFRGKPYGWVLLRKGGVQIPRQTLGRYGIQTEDLLLVIRGSGLAMAFSVKGPIVEETRKHPELGVFKPK